MNRWRVLWKHVRHKRLHGKAHADHERRVALVMIFTGFARVVVWLAITAAFIARVGFVVHWFSSVAFVSLLSILALVLTDWGQVAASLAQLTAGDEHQDAERAREAPEPIGRTTSDDGGEW